MNELSFELYACTGWRPKVDVYRCADGWLVKLEIAGVAEQDIRTEVQHDVLIVEGRRRDLCIPNILEPMSMEINYDHFRRTVRLPGVIESTQIRTEYSEGMLLIKLRNRE